ncbi:rab1 small GTP-binding protein, partial [Trypanosoma cruzi]
LNLEWIMSRLNPTTLESLMQVWGLVGRSPFPPSSSGKARKGSRRISTADARLPRKAGIIEDASSTITGGWIIPFSVVEEKTTGLRRRWIAWPRDKNRDDPYEAHVPLLHISHYLLPVMAEAASCLDVKAFLFQVSLPREIRHLFRCRVEDGTLVELTRHLMGYKAGQKFSRLLLLRQLRGDDGGSPPLGCTSIGACRRLDRQYTHYGVEKRCDIVGSPSAS